MAYEIERKFLVADPSVVAGLTGTRLIQGYLNVEGTTTRVRLVGENKAYLTLKGATQGVTRLEFEYEIPRDDGEQLLKLCGSRVLSKTRYAVLVGDHVWDVDVFEGKLQGLMTAEVELKHESEPFQMPAWVGEDVSHCPQYFNQSLAAAVCS